MPLDPGKGKKNEKNYERWGFLGNSTDLEEGEADATSLSILFVSKFDIPMGAVTKRLVLWTPTTTERVVLVWSSFSFLCREKFNSACYRIWTILGHSNHMFSFLISMFLPLNRIAQRSRRTFLNRCNNFVYVCRVGINPRLFFEFEHRLQIVGTKSCVSTYSTIIVNRDFLTSIVISFVRLPPLKFFILKPVCSVCAVTKGFVIWSTASTKSDSSTTCSLFSRWTLQVCNNFFPLFIKEIVRTVRKWNNFWKLFLQNEGVVLN